MKTMEIKQIVKERYGRVAETGGKKESSCCASEATKAASFATEHGLYGQKELSLIPEIALNLSKGCGNPTGFADLQSGEIVVDFGCGAGIDTILAAQKTSPSGRVIGVDFTPEMIDCAKQAVSEVDLESKVEFRISDLEQLDLPDSFADVVISNCVINLCPDKEAVYREAFRILKSEGRLAISDIVYTEEPNPQVKGRFQATWAGCVGGAIEEDSYFETIQKAGFTQIEVVARHPLPPKELESMASCPGPEYTPVPAKEDLAKMEEKVISIKFKAIKP